MRDPGTLAHSIPRNAGDLTRTLRDLQRGLDELAGLFAVEAWQPATLVNSWAVLSEAAQYRLEPGGDVRMSGRIQLGATGSVALTLDSDHVPAVRQDFPLVTNVAGSFGAAQVAVSGDVTITIPGGATWVSLASVRFPTS